MVQEAAKEGVDLLEGVQMLLTVLDFAGADGLGDGGDRRFEVREEPAHL